MSNRPNCHVVTGNLTSDGSVVYLDANQGWVEEISRAQAFDQQEAAEQELAAVAAHEEIITEPYIFPALRTENDIQPTSAREILRAEGPSTRIRRPDPAQESPP